MTSTALRIDKLNPGAFVRLGFKGDRDELAIFLGVKGEGEDRRATFVSTSSDGRSTFDWDAYRFNRGWAYGSSADRLRLLEVIS